MKVWADFRHLVTALLFAALAGGCATSSHNPADPLESMNRATFGFNEGFDKVIFKPGAQVYKTVLPQPVRQCVGNVFANVGDVLVSVNSLLQGKAGDAVSDACRVLVNTTIGLGGCFDVASKMGLEKHNRDFGQTMGKWGVAPGPYLVLPILGPSDFRDGLGYVMTTSLDPVWHIPYVPLRNEMVVLRAVSIRADLLSASDVLEQAALDKYSFVRDAYLQRRQNMIEDDDSAMPEKKPEQKSEAGPLPLAFKAAMPTSEAVPGELWLDEANQRVGAGGEAAIAHDKADSAARGESKAGRVVSSSL
ncbi:MAG TPA: VacJ family lipoprotein [Burkholderiales bacterium]|jgi:phospholipid-binding lipoprotein MlaA